jgi:hypothetical protein
MEAKEMTHKQAAQVERLAATEGAAPAPLAAPGPVGVTDAEALQFVYDGRQRITALAVAVRNLREWVDVFEQRGGAAVYGEDALAMVYLYNDLQAGFLDATKRALFARLRTDI